MTRSVLVILALFVGAPLGAQEEPEETSGPPVLFDSEETLEITIEADFDQIDGDREEESEERPAVLRWTEPDGTAMQQDIQIRTRGKFRLQRSTCSRPNLRLNVRTGASEGTLFQGQDKLKLVGFCRDRDNYEQNVLEEYLAYKLYNLFTDASFKARLLRVTYVDTSGGDDPVTRYGFVIEDEEALAARFDGILMEIPQAPPEYIPSLHAARLALFQYMIGNTDWSAVFLHNVRLVRTPEGEFLTVPYDFDWSGLVDAPYADPAEELEIRNVRTRLYRGFCRQDISVEDVLSEFRDRREAVYATVQQQEGLEDGSREDAIEYLDDFYEMLEDGDRAQRLMERECRSLG